MSIVPVQLQPRTFDGLVGVCLRGISVPIRHAIDHAIGGVTTIQWVIAGCWGLSVHVRRV